MEKRSISNSFLAELKGGKFKEIVRIVSVDPNLDLELRGDSVMVYYRGGKVLTISDPELYPDLRDLDYLTGMDSNYSNGGKCPQAIPTPCINDMLSYFAKAKHVVDNYEKHVKEKLGEKEIQQRVISENNSMVNANETDFFFADMEWAENSVLKGRADLIAFHWGHMQHKKKNLTMYLIEVKQGCNAVRTKSQKETDDLTPGLCKHLQDFNKLKGNEELIEELKTDMLNVLCQKYCLGLITGLENLFVKTSDGFTTEGITIQKDVKFVFLLANYLYYSDNLKNEFEELPKDSLFYVSSFLGYGLYEKFIFTKEELMEKFPFVFTRKKN